MALGAVGGILGAAAGGTVGRAIVEVIGDSSKLQADLAKAKAQTATATQQMGAKTSKFSALSTGAFVAIGTAAVAGVGFAIKAASDLNEQMNRARVVFEDSADSVVQFSETSADKLGIAQSAALEAASSFGAMAQAAGLSEAASAQMSIKLVTLAADMASFNNQDPSEMLIRLRAGLAGEAEPLRRFSVFISEARVKTEAYTSGIAAAGSELTDAQKIQARFNLIMKDTAKQQGDFARTVGESLPNQLRRLKAGLTDTAAELGQALLPAITAFVKALNLLTPLLGPAIQGAVALGAAFLAYKALSFLPGLLVAIGAAMQRFTLLQGAGAAVGNLGIGFAGLLPALGSVAIGIGALILAGEGLQGLINKLTNTVSTEQALATATTQLQQAVASGKFTWAEIQGAVDEYNRTIGSLPGAEKLTMDAIRGTGGAAAGTAGQVGDLATAHGEAAAAARDQLAAELALAGGFVGVAASIDSAADAETTLAEARAEVARLTREGKTGTQEYKDAVEAVDDAARGSLQSQLSLAGSVQKFVEEAAKTGDVRTAVALVREYGQKAGLTAGEIQTLITRVRGLIKDYKDVPESIATTVKLNNSAAIQRLRELQDKYRSIKSEIEGTITIGTRPGPLDGSKLPPGTKGGALGGIIAGASGFITRGPTMLVGESRKMTFAGRGAEAVIPFDQRGIGILAKALEKAGSGTVVQESGNYLAIHFNAPIYGMRDFRRQVERALEEASARFGMV